MLDSRNIGNWEWLWFLQLFPGSYILQCGSTLALRDWICCIIIDWDLWLIPLQVFECRSERFSTPEWRSIWGTRLVSVCLIQPAWLELTLVLVQLAWISAPVCHNLALQTLRTCPAFLRSKSESLWIMWFDIDWLCPISGQSHLRSKIEEPRQALGTNKKFVPMNFLHRIPYLSCEQRATVIS